MAEDKQTPSDERLLEIMSRYVAARDFSDEWRRDARMDFDFYAGKQWTPEDRTKMEQQLRVPITFNRLGVLVDAVIGYETNNRQETRYIPRTQGDAKINEVVTEAGKYFRDQCDAEFEESDAFRDMCICGMGWTEDYITDEENPDYDLKRTRVDPLEMLWDPSAKKPNLADARYIFRKKWFPREELKSRFPTWDGQSTQADWMNDEFDTNSGIHQNNPRTAYKGDNGETSAISDIPVLEYQYVEHTEVYRIQNPMTGKKITLSEGEYNKLSREEKALFPAVKGRKREWCRLFLIGGEIVEEGKPYPEGPTYGCITGKRDRNDNTWFGIIRMARDPQMWSNKWLSQIMHLINTTAKPGYDLEQGAVKDQASFERNAGKPGALNVFTDGALQKGRVQRREMAPLPPDLAKLLEYANQSMSDVTGVNQELLGMADREQAGVLEYQRKQSAVTLLAPLFDSMRRYRKMAGRRWFKMMKEFMTDGRLIRVTQDVPVAPPIGMPDVMQQNMDPAMMQQMRGNPQVQQKEVYIPFTEQFFDPEVEEYDVIVDQSSSAPNLKEETWAALQPVMQTFGQMMSPQHVELMLEYSPLPESFMEKFREIQQEQAQQPPPPDPEMLKAQTQIQTAQQMAQIKQQESQQALQLEREKAAMQMQIEREKAALQMQIERDKAFNQIQIEQMKAKQQAEINAISSVVDLKQQEQTGNIKNALAVKNAEAEGQRADMKTKSEIERQNKLATAKAKLAKAQPKKPKG